MRTAGRVLGILALLLFVGLGIGLALPGTWEVERSRTIEAEPHIVHGLLADPEAWQRWTVWPETARRIPAPERGVGAGWEWDDGTYGEGRFTLTRIAPGQEVGYAVEVEGGKIRISGTLVLQERAGATRVVWSEVGDFGRNPLLGYQALFMEGDQGRQLERSLERLDALVQEDLRR